MELQTDFCFLFCITHSWDSWYSTWHIEDPVNGCWINELINKLSFMICMLSSVIYVKFQIKWLRRKQRQNRVNIALFTGNFHCLPMDWKHCKINKQMIISCKNSYVDLLSLLYCLLLVSPQGEKLQLKDSYSISWTLPCIIFLISIQEFQELAVGESAAWFSMPFCWK